MIELTPIDKNEWMPRVRVLVMTSVAEAREALDECAASDIHSSINCLQIVAQRPDFAEWPEGYIVRLAWEPSAIAGWADAQLVGNEPGRQVGLRAAELSWETADRSRGHGYMREAMPRIVRWLLERRGMAEVRAWIPVGAEASEKVARAGQLLPTGRVDQGAGTQLWKRRAASAGRAGCRRPRGRRAYEVLSPSTPSTGGGGDGGGREPTPIS
jgi:hypothetical protein